MEVVGGTQAWIAKHDRDPVFGLLTKLGAWARKDGKVDAGETGLDETFTRFRPSDKFVQDLSNSSMAEFKQRIGSMTDGAKRLYLYNKYPFYFAAFEKPGLSEGKVHRQNQRDGIISHEELVRAAGSGSYETMLNSMHQHVTDAKDLWLLTQISMFQQPLFDYVKQNPRFKGRAQALFDASQNKDEVSTPKQSAAETLVKPVAANGFITALGGP